MKPAPRSPIADWQAIHAQLAKANLASEAEMRLSPERARAVMDQRARELARVPAAPVSGAKLLELVTFRRSSERFGLESRFVREVFQVREVTPVPGTPDFLIGIANLRGQVLALIDLGNLLGLAESSSGNLSRVVVLGEERAEFGVAVDAVDEVIPLRMDDVLVPQASLAGIGRGYLCGVTKDALIVLDGAVLLQDPRLVIDQDEQVNP